MHIYGQVERKGGREREMVRNAFRNKHELYPAITTNIYHFHAVAPFVSPYPMLLESGLKDLEPPRDATHLRASLLIGA